MTELRIMMDEYEAYVRSQEKEGLTSATYDVWIKQELQRRNVDQKPKVKTVNRHVTKMIELKMIGELVAMQSKFHDRYADIIWGKDKRLSDWDERHHALDMMLSQMRQDIEFRINAYKNEIRDL